MLLITISSNALTLHGFTKEEKVAIRAIIKMNKNQELIEVTKGSNTAFKTVIEFTTKMYVLDHTIVESIYILGDGDWKELQSLDEAYSYEQKNTQAFVFNFDENKDEQRIEIQPINGTPSWYLYYQDSFWDNRIQAMVYYNDDITVIIGDSYVIYEDSLDSWKFDIPQCSEEITKN